MTRLKTWRARGAQFMLALTAAMAAGGAARAQTDVPTVISPLRAENDRNNVNLTDGRTTMSPPVLTVPGAPNLRFDRIQNAAPYVKGNIQQTGPGEYPQRSYSVHTGTGTSESFQCFDFDCSSVTGTGSTFQWNINKFRQAGSAAVWTYNRIHVSTSTALLAYASGVSYPNGENIGYTYDTATLINDPYPGRLFYRPNKISSNLGYEISITYQGNDFNANPTTWATPSVVTLYATANPTTALGRLTYSGNTITDLAGRVYTCTGCTNTLGSDLEVAAGSTQLPGEGTPDRTVVSHPSVPVVQSVTRDGVQYTYSYLNLRPAPQPFAWLYDRITVDGPNGYHQVYNMVAVGSPTQKRNVMINSVDSINRTTSYLFDEAYRLYQLVSPEGNQVNVSYDSYGNITWRRTRAKAGSGLADIIETATFPTDTCFTSGTPILCYRPSSSRDGLNRQTDYAYNGLGQVTEQIEPADAAGVRRRTSTTYETAALSRRNSVRVCNDTGVTCGTNAPIRTEYVYWGSTFLPSIERRIDAAQGVTLETAYGYDAAGRLTSTDGPLAGDADATYSRYDIHGRKTWEIGAVGGNGLRAARRFTFRDSDDKPITTETGTVPDQYSATLTVFSRNDVTYDSRRYPIREAVSASGATSSVTDKAFDDQGRHVCTAIRMNPAAFGQMPGACALTTQGSQGPDRITVNTYDAAGQLLQEIRAYLTGSQQNYATYTYNPNGTMRTLADANGNTSYFNYNGHDRRDYWVMPSRTATGSWDWTDYEYYAYDLVGNRTTLRKRDGSWFSYQFDGLNRMSAKFVPERAGLDPSNTRDVYYAYNHRNQQTEARFDSLAGDGVSNTYDAFGQMTSSTSRWGALVRTLSYQHDAGGRRTRITHPDTQAFTYAYSPAGELTGVYQGIGTSAPLTLFTYNAQARLAGRTEGPGSTVAYTYDGAGRPTGITDTFVGGTGNVALTLGYNPASQITTRTRNNDAYATNTAYNVSRGYSVNGLNQYTVAGTASFGYDANGNLTSDGSRTFTYDVENRLVAASGGVSMGYDPMGRLGWTTGSPNFTRFLYDGNALVAEYDYSGNLVHRYVHGSNPQTDDPLVWYDGATVRWLHTDQQGSVVAATNGSGALASINAYDAWGIPNAANVGRFQYTGQTWMPELGMYYYKARMYSPSLGRFMQTDPVAYDDDVNLYAYVGNDPVNRTDPDGLSCKQNQDGRSVTCKIDNPGNLRARALDRANRAYTRAVNRLLHNPNRRMTLQARNSSNNLVSRVTTAGQIATALIEATVDYGGDSPAMASLGGNKANASTTGTVGTPQGVRIKLYTEGLLQNVHALGRTIVHEGAHGTTANASLRSVTNPSTFNSSHQDSFKAGAANLYNNYDD